MNLCNLDAALIQLAKSEIVNFLKNTNNGLECCSPVLVFPSELHDIILRKIKFQAEVNNLAYFDIVVDGQKKLVICRETHLSDEKKEEVLYNKMKDRELLSTKLYEYRTTNFVNWKQHNGNSDICVETLQNARNRMEYTSNILIGQNNVPTAFANYNNQQLRFPEEYYNYHQQNLPNNQYVGQRPSLNYIQQTAMPNYHYPIDINQLQAYQSQQDYNSLQFWSNPISSQINEFTQQGTRYGYTNPEIRYTRNSNVIPFTPYMNTTRQTNDGTMPLYDEAVGELDTQNTHQHLFER